MKPRGEVGVGGAQKRFELFADGVALRDDIGAQQARAEHLRSTAGLLPLPPLLDLGELGLESVVVAHA